MPLNYDVDENWKAFLPVLDEHGEWFLSFVQHLFYFEQAAGSVELIKPSSFAKWAVGANRGGDIQVEIIEKLSHLHQDLMRSSEQLLQIVRANHAPPGWVEFQNFMLLYEEFMHQIRRLEKDFMIEGSGYDRYTGLRSKKMLVRDVERELQRLVRRGKSFCIALAKIDNFSSILNYATPGEVDGYICLVANLIKLSIRSFDDAYYMGRNEFVLCLKQTTVSGGIAALERMKRELEGQELFVNLGEGEKKRLSMSCCIVEPVDGDSIDKLVEDLRNDLKSARDVDVDTVLQYHELSPLQKYVKGER